MTAARILKTAAYTAGALTALTVVGFLEGLRRYDCCPHDENF